MGIEAGINRLRRALETEGHPLHTARAALTSDIAKGIGRATLIAVVAAGGAYAAGRRQGHNEGYGEGFDGGFLVGDFVGRLDAGSQR
jgi:hypothetical protein